MPVSPTAVSEDAPALGGSPLLSVEGLSVEFSAGVGRPPIRAVDDVSFQVAARETVGLVGESGSGKTTIGRAILGLAPIKRGRVSLAGVDITRAGYRQRRAISVDLQAVFQDPYSSLNPTRTIEQTLAETVHALARADRTQVADRVRTMLVRVGLGADAAGRYPSDFSGGQRQRIAIARALMANPKLVICDEPTSALDLSVQAQVLNLLRELQTEFDLSYLFVSHDLSVVRHLSHRMIVLNHGRVMEEGAAATISANPVHPYTRALLAAAPVPDPVEQRRRRLSLTSEPRSLLRRGDGTGCPFAGRCPHTIPACVETQPPLETTSTGQQVACHRWRELEGVTG